MTFCGYEMPIALGRMIALEVKETLAVFTEFTVLSILCYFNESISMNTCKAPSRKQKVSINKDLKK